MSNNIEFGRIIKCYRKSARLSREKCAKLCSISESYMGDIERGTSEPRFHIVADLCNVCGIDISVLYRLYHPDEQ